MELTQELVRELFYIENGVLRWKKTASSRATAGSAVGHKDERGYSRLKIKGKSYLLHRVIFLWHHGFLPIEVDHKNRSPDTNDIANLRAATSSNNQWNKSLQSNNTSGFKGVTWHDRDCKWMAQIAANGKTHFLGYFETTEAAAEAYSKAAAQLHGDFARVT